MVSSYIRNRFTKLFALFLFKNADHIIAVSPYTKDDLVKNFKRASKNITVVPVGIDLNDYQWLSSFDDKHINLVHVGGFTFEKNHERLIYMFRELFLKNNRFRLWLIGDGPLLKNIRALADKLEVSNYIFFQGFVPNPLDYIYSSDILLLPSKIEGLPAVILEAFYCRVPVVAYNVGGIGQVVKNNDTGWLVEPDKESDFIESVLAVSLSRKEDIGVITNNAYQEVVTEYSNINIAGKCINVYQQLLKEYSYSSN